MARILGLDLGRASVKAVLLDTSDRDQPVQRVLEVPRPAEGDRMETLRAALRELTAEPLGELDQVIVALPGPALATHVLTLPFSDVKRLEAALPFEVEAQLPFDLSEAVFDYQVAHRTEAKSDVLVGVVRTTELQALLALLAECGFDPRVVSHPALVYQSLLPLLPPGEPRGVETLAIVDIGFERTTLAIGTAGGELEFGRTFAGGGRDLSRALAAELEVSEAQANHWKEHQGAVGMVAQDADAERAAAALVRGLQPLLRELRSTLKAHSARTRRSVTRILLCGGTAKLPGLAEQLAQDLDLSVANLELPESIVGANAGPAVLSSAQALALALRGQATGPRAPHFNLRRGEFAFKGHYDFVRERVGQLAAFVAVLVLLFSGFFVARNIALGQREARVDSQLCELTLKTLGKCEKSFDRALNLMRGKESPTAAVPKLSAVNLLAELVKRVPEDVPVVFDQIVVEGDRMSLRGQVENGKQVDRIQTALKGYRCFHEVQEGKREKSKDNKMNFHLEVQVECPEIATSPAG